MPAPIILKPVVRINNFWYFPISAQQLKCHSTISFSFELISCNWTFQYHSLVASIASSKEYSCLFVTCFWLLSSIAVNCNEIHFTVFSHFQLDVCNWKLSNSDCKINLSILTNIWLFGITHETQILIARHFWKKFTNFYN